MRISDWSSDVCSSDLVNALTAFRNVHVIGPSGDERRLPRRALYYWRAVKRNGEFALLHEFDPLYLEDRSSHGFLLDVFDPQMPMLRYAGSALRDEAAISQDNIPLSDVSSAYVLGRFSTRSEVTTSELQ